MKAQSDPLAIPRKGKVKGSPPKVLTASGKSIGKRLFNVKGLNVDRATGKMVRNDGLVLNEVVGSKPDRPLNLTQSVRKGLPFIAIDRLAKAYGANQKEISKYLSITASTLRRRKEAGRLNTGESDRVVRLAKLIDAARDLMEGDAEAALIWLRTPLAILGDESPLSYASTEAGAAEIHDLIGRLQHGVFN